MPTIVLNNRIGGGAPETFGPFRQVEIRHRRLFGDGEQLALRGSGDGAWRTADDARYLEARIVGDEDRLRLVFAEPWRAPELVRDVGELRLHADYLYVDDDSTPVAYDSDDDRSWVKDPEGDAYGRLLAG